MNNHHSCLAHYQYEHKLSQNDSIEKAYDYLSVQDFDYAPLELFLLYFYLEGTILLMITEK
jgi:hypothetical protein